jgi:hypothetical protein
MVCGSALAQTRATIRTDRVHNPGKWLAEVHWLDFQGKSPLAELAERTVKTDQLKARKAWLDEIGPTMKERGNWRGDPVELYWNSQAGISKTPPALLSVVVRTEFYSGGAHGMSFTRTYNFWHLAGKPKTFGLWDALKGDAASRRELDYLLMQKALADNRTAWVDEGMITDFKQQNLSRFYFTRDGITFVFDPYELGPYAVGTIELSIPYGELKPIIRPKGPLSFVH